MTAVWFQTLFYLNRVVGEEVIESVKLITAVITVVLPHDSKRKNFAIVIKEALKVLVWTTAFQKNLDVVFVFSHIWRVLFHIDKSTSVYKRIIRILLSITKSDTFIGVERTSKFVAIDDAENTSVKLDVNAYV